MAFFDLHEWPLTVLFAALLAASLSLQNLPAERGALRDAAVCEKPGFAAFGLFLPLH